MQKQLKTLRERAENLPEFKQHRYLPVLDKLGHALQHHSLTLSFMEEAIEDLGAFLPSPEVAGEAPATPTEE